MTLQATGNLKLVDGDIGLPETAQRVIVTAMRDFGHIDLLVNNAGVFIPKPFTEYRVEDFGRAIYLCAGIIPRLKCYSSRYWRAVSVLSEKSFLI
jgi:NADP-dependent 3-hydroxy acid dehydrogenase YdfG